LGRAVVLHDGDDHGAVRVLEAGDHTEGDQGAVLAAADRHLARASGNLTRAYGAVELQAVLRDWPPLRRPPRRPTP
jgi:hypothetical protein